MAFGDESESEYWIWGADVVDVLHRIAGALSDEMRPTAT